MAAPSQQPRAAEREWESNDPVVAANALDLDEPVQDPNALDDSEKGESLSSSEPHHEVAKKPHVKWSTRINPLKWNPPPVPDQRPPSREPDAGIFSILTFQWATPIMTVSKWGFF